MMVPTVASAQLTTGKSSATQLKTGNRPGAGDWGVYVGVAYSDFKNIFDKDVNFEGFPLVNLKYYLTDNIELRLGLQFQGTSTSSSGSFDDEFEVTEYTESSLEGDLEGGESIASTSTITSMSSFANKASDRTNRIKPGVAYHFSNKNLLDVYMGAELPIGWNNRSISYYETEYSSSDYDNSYSKTISNSPFFIGFGAFIGLQCFVADLPLAIGIEYGILGIKEFGYDKTKVITLDEKGDKQTQYLIGTDNTYYDSLNSTRTWFSNDARVTLTYYFKTK